ncbi:unnamed protein product (macronuclear) [Paramecium tetraurelia]|uniref:PX domain-containing protein n=1 Tax=Paramecium tetraurelia TaxID=5888 RepID=A0D4B6_PARTE|nr:uncharacterized protein GSPATT00013349001 [Paramecium tetraurelia]CAK77883.1 unnamed protein product [Paramecium tetraurelia]|eukprot:XP_001445280.1 hypothetical protein (macronuclear) [Paramecium tetraurelia strain d4-2]
MIRYGVTINDYETRNDVIYYTIHVNDQKAIKALQKRYSDLKALNQKIYQKNNEFKLKLSLPRFPRKKMFGRTKNSQSDIKTRGLELQQYLEIILNIPTLWSFQFFREFLPQAELLDETFRLEQINTEYSKDLCWLQMDELKKSFLQRQEQFQSNKKNKQKGKEISGYYQRFHFTINEFAIQNDFVLYFIILTDTKKTTKYRFEARYSNLRDCHHLLEKQQFKNSLFHFPKRRLIGQTRDNPQLIQERQEQLQRYLNQTFSVQEFVESEPLVYFITKIKLEGKPIKQNLNERVSQLSQQVIGSSFNLSQGIEEIREQKSC